jgi:uncharacterized coiled-coil DUF342 family protein
MSDDIHEILEEIEDVHDCIAEFNQKMDLLRSEVDTIGNVLLQLIHARNAAAERGEE